MLTGQEEPLQGRPHHCRIKCPRKQKGPRPPPLSGKVTHSPPPGWVLSLVKSDICPPSLARMRQKGKKGVGNSSDPKVCLEGLWLLPGQVVPGCHTYTSARAFGEGKRYQLLTPGVRDGAMMGRRWAELPEKGRNSSAFSSAQQPPANLPQERQVPPPEVTPELAGHIQCPPTVLEGYSQLGQVKAYR